MELDKIGDLLKEAREAKRITRSSLAESLRIGEEQLIALENGQEDLLPEPVFIKAMIRRVAEKLSIDKNPLIEEFDKKLPSSSIINKQDNPKKSFLGTNNHINFNKAFTTFILLVLVITSQFFRRVNNDFFTQKKLPKDTEMPESIVEKTKGIPQKRIKSGSKEAQKLSTVLKLRRLAGDIEDFD